MTDQRNVPVPDELAATREQIKALETREAELRRLLITNPDLREGAAWLAEIKVSQQERTDLKEMRANHPDIVEQYTFPTEITRRCAVRDHGGRRDRGLPAPCGAPRNLETHHNERHHRSP
jgi:hypothetical protein